MVSSRGKLPLDIGIFVGRETEMVRASRLLSRVRLLTLTGPGGVGKTRLALRLAHRLANNFDDVWVIDFGTVPSPTDCTPDRLYAHMVMALGIRHHGAPGLEVLLDHIRKARVLLILDTCEHLLPVLRVCATTLLRAAPQVRLLATSREALAADGEHTLVVPPLELPDAIDLFITAARAAGANVSKAETKEIGELCRRLDGLPLAIRLSAGRTRTLSAQQLLHRLDDRWRLLTDASGNRHRHSTLERVVAWSYDLCTPAEQLLWARASVFAAAFDLRAIEAVCGGDGLDQADIVDLVTGLVGKSVFATASGSTTRYYLLETLRDYGRRVLARSLQMIGMRQRHRDYYRDLVAEAAESWCGPAELDVMAAVYRELPDILEAIDESLLRRETAIAQAMCRDLIRLRAPLFWGFLELAGRETGRVIEVAGRRRIDNAEDAADLAATIAFAAWVAVLQGRHDAAQTMLATAHKLHDQWNIGTSAPVVLAEGSSEAFGAASVRAISLLEQARSAFTDASSAGDRHTATMLWAMASSFAGTPDAAVAASEEHLRQAQEAQAPWAISLALWTSALAALRSGDHVQAGALIDEGLRLQRDMDDQWGQTWGVELCGWIIASALEEADDPEGEAERAAWLLGAARARQQRLGVDLSGLRPLLRMHELARAQIGAVLSEKMITTVMEAGSRGHSKALQVALGETTSRRPTASGAGRLTAREREVAALVADGLTSVEIGAQLRINPRTVDVHVGRIMAKLGIRRRTAIASWVADQVARQQPPGTPFGD